MVELFQKLAGSWDSVPSRAPQSTKHPLSPQSARKRVNFLPKAKKKEKTTSGVFSLDLFRVALSKSSPFFLWRSRPKKEPKKSRWNHFAPAGATRASPVNFWMLNFAEIQHQVASKTLENTTTFTRHHAFLKRLDPNFQEFGPSVWVYFKKSGPNP